MRAPGFLIPLFAFAPVAPAVLFSLCWSAISQAANDTVKIQGSDPIAIYVLNNDASGDSIASVTTPEQGTANISGETVVYTPPSGYVGPDTFSYTTTGGTFSVSLTVMPQSLESAIERRLAAEPAFRVEFVDKLLSDIQAMPAGDRAIQLREAIQARAARDPLFSRRFEAAFRASGIQQAIDLYVLLGDGNLQGVTESGAFNDPGGALAERLAARSGNAVVVLNCAVAGSAMVQWSSIGAPAFLAPRYLGAERRLDWSEQCMDTIDSMIRAANVSVTVRGVAISLGGNSAIATGEGAPAALLDRWGAELARMVALYRGSYGEQLVVLMLAMAEPDESADAALGSAWDAIQEQQRGYRSYRFQLIETAGIATWQDGSPLPLFSDAGQQTLVERLQAGFISPMTPNLAETGDCTPSDPCFPGTNQRIEPATCAGSGFFRRGNSEYRVLCDQYGNNLHAMAAACDGCIEPAAIAGGLGLAVVTASTGPDFQARAFNRQRLDGADLGPLPYDNPASTATELCGAFDRESFQFLLSPGSHQYLVQARLVEACTADDRRGCGPLLGPDDVVQDSYERAFSISAGECLRITAGEEAPAPEPVAAFADVQARIFDRNCATSGCHAGSSPAQGMNLSAGVARRNIVGVASRQQPSLLRIDPGDPDNSYLVQKVEGRAASGSRMPLGRSALSPELIQLLRDWVAAGATAD